MSIDSGGNNYNKTLSYYRPAKKNVLVQAGTSHAKIMTNRGSTFTQSFCQCSAISLESSAGSLFPSILKLTVKPSYTN